MTQTANNHCQDMKSIGSVFNQITLIDNLKRSVKAASKGKRNRNPVIRFLNNSTAECIQLHIELDSGTYRPGPYTQFKIKDPKPRLITCADFRDRVVHHAVCDITGPLIERRFIFRSFACRKGKGFHRAVNTAQDLARKYKYFLKLDIRSFYDTVDQDIAEKLVLKLFREKQMRELWTLLIRHPFPGQSPGKGLPIGNLTSQWIANLYLDGLDHYVTEQSGLSGYIRYMDDFIIFHHSKSRLWQALEETTQWLAYQRKLTLKSSSTVLAPCSEGIPFLRMRIFPGMIRLSGEKLRRTRRLVRGRNRQFQKDEISTSEYVRSLQAMIGITACWKIAGVVQSEFDL